jgi:quinate dehydrogenase (quinone)
MEKHATVVATQRFFIRGLGISMIAASVALLVGGFQLLVLGGSAYYVCAGILLFAAGVLITSLRNTGVWVYFGLVGVTVIWSLWEVGLDFWGLFARLFAPALLALPVTLVLLKDIGQSGPARRAPVYCTLGFVVTSIAAVLISAIYPHGVIHGKAPPLRAMSSSVVSSDWPAYGRTLAGTRFSPISEINPTNVGRLAVAWQFRTGAVHTADSEDQNTPIEVDDTVFICTPSDVVFALDADTGRQIWKFDPKVPVSVWPRCRGVSYYRVGNRSDQPSSTPALCDERIALNTTDARLISLDAKTGTPCPGFGAAGTVDLRIGMGEFEPSLYFQTSAPVVAAGKIIIGGFVLDNLRTQEPSGVIRAFNATTGALEWAWDLGNANITRLPPNGETYTKETPNVWSEPSVDEHLGLVYLPTGNSTPDFWGGHRSKESESYSSSVVALDISSGKERWRFQTVHHDLWDLDVASQPALYDIPNGHGETIPALIQLTKRGQIFVLDRRNGKPITEVVERAVPQQGQSDDWTSKTQPYSVGMPQIGTQVLTEKRMWGITPFDQLWCRLAFKRARYEGEFTPATTNGPSLMYPGFFGGMNWGSAAIDEDTGYLIFTDIRVPVSMQLLPRAEVNRLTALAGTPAAPHDAILQQSGTPYGATTKILSSPLRVPCNEPPFGTMTAINLVTREIAWQTPIGTTLDSGPRGIATRVPFEVGMPTMGGALVTRSGLTFFTGTQDSFLRAIESATGKEIVKIRLPVGSQGTPATFISKRTHHQYIVLVAGGARLSPKWGDYIIAYRLLPQKDGATEVAN